MRASLTAIVYNHHHHHYHHFSDILNMPDSPDILNLYIWLYRGTVSNVPMRYETAADETIGDFMKALCGSIDCYIEEVCLYKV